jgi:hypothetical protein
MNEPLRLLTGNAALQVFVSSLLGFAMLIPRQPWAKRLAPHFDQKALLSVHLDWLMLAFMQWGAVLVMTQWPGAARPWVAWLLTPKPQNPKTPKPHSVGLLLLELAHVVNFFQKPKLFVVRNKS